MKDGSGNPAVWAIWFTAVLVSVSLTKNPLYLLIILLAVGAVIAARRAEASSGPWRAFVGLGLSFVFISATYNILISHYGETVLLTLPAGIPLVGGPLTLEAAVFGLTFGLTFMAGLLAFAALNMAVGTGELLRILPKGMRGASTVISVSLNFIPATVSAAAEISQAQTIRRLEYGTGLTGRIRKAGAAFVPLVITGLEKAVVMAESMESRAYGGGDTTKLKRARRRWTAADYLLAAFSVTAVAVMLFCLAAGTGWLIYSPYPKIAVPGFNPAVGLALALLAAPAVSK
ncbi:MAG: energy-coupling factor transporter transmembrane component T [Actinomycetota bacterium]